MFCSKCGKQIDYDASVCNECAGIIKPPALKTEQKPKEISLYAKYKQATAKGSMTTGLKGAGLSVVFGLIGIIVYLFALPRMMNGMVLLLGWFLLIISLVFDLIGLSNGISSIKAFIHEGKMKRTRPVPMLLLGIIGIQIAATVLLCLQIFLFSYLFL